MLWIKLYFHADTSKLLLLNLNMKTVTFHMKANFGLRPVSPIMFRRLFSSCTELAALQPCSTLLCNYNLPGLLLIDASAKMNFTEHFDKVIEFKGEYAA